MTRAELTKLISDALERHAVPDALEAVEVLDPTGEFGNEGVLSIAFPGDEESTFVTITLES